MGLLSSSVSITHYRVQGDLPEPVLETVAAGLNKFAITEIDDDAVEKSVGWTCSERPYSPDFSDSSFVTGDYLIFSLRIDKKNIPSKLVAKGVAVEADRMLARTGRRTVSGG